MFGFRKSNPPSDNESDAKKQTGARRTSSEPSLAIPDDDFGKGSSAPRNKNRHKNKEELDSMSVQELESYAVNKAEDTTNSVNNCLRIAEDIRETASTTLDELNKQGDQIHRTHEKAAEMEKDLSKGEKLLNGLGGMFSMPWKPKKTKEITGPKTSKDDNHRRQATAEQREKLGVQKGKRAKSTPPPEPKNAYDKIELENSKQDDALDDLSDILGDLKGMATDMGSELDRQNQALDHLDEDIDELNSRVKGATRRAAKIAGK